MTVLFTLTDADLHIPSPHFKVEQKLKKVRAIVFNKGKIALLWIKKNNYHVLPGGTVEEGEDLENALLRELKEETGCEVQIGDYIGSVVELRSRQKIAQITYYWHTTVLTEHEVNFTKEEKEQGFELKWVGIGEALDLISNDKPLSYGGLFNKQREKRLLSKILNQRILETYGPSWE